MSEHDMDHGATTHQRDDQEPVEGVNEEPYDKDAALDAERRLRGGEEHGTASPEPGDAPDPVGPDGQHYDREAGEDAERKLRGEGAGKDR